MLEESRYIQYTATKSKRSAPVFGKPSALYCKNDPTLFPSSYAPKCEVQAVYVVIVKGPQKGTINTRFWRRLQLLGPMYTYSRQSPTRLGLHSHGGNKTLGIRVRF